MNRTRALASRGRAASEDGRELAESPRPAGLRWSRAAREVVVLARPVR
jgi:hypothetical protein